MSRIIKSSKTVKRKSAIYLHQFSEMNQKVLIHRKAGGLGDILMHRMLFEDFHRVMPGVEIHFACPKTYHDAVSDHPFIAKVLDSDNVDKYEYLISYDTTTACSRYELKSSPYVDMHRSDIWATHCGVTLTKHNMHINLTPEELVHGKALVEKVCGRDGRSVCFCPISAMESKNLQGNQQLEVARGLRDRGYNVFGLHTTPIKPLVENQIPCLYNLSIREWMAVISVCDYVVSVDTAAFHCAGGLKKPLVGIFTWADAVIYGKYFDFLMVQKHRDIDPSWTCGPCYNWGICPKSKSTVKPCLTDITPSMILTQADKMFEKWPINSK